MPQTLLALLAMMLATLFAFNQQRRVAATQFNMIRDEIETQATIVAQDRLEEIGSMAFDEATVGEKRVTSSAELTAGPPFEEDAQGNDIDDFHLVTIDTLRSSNAGDLRFRVYSEVAYVLPDEPDAEVSYRTKAKKATVTVYSLDIDPANTITMSQSYTCGSRCDF